MALHQLETLAPSAPNIGYTLASVRLSRGPISREPEGVAPLRQRGDSLGATGASLTRSGSCRRDGLAQLDLRWNQDWQAPGIGSSEIKEGWNAFFNPFWQLLGPELLLSRRCCQLTNSGITARNIGRPTRPVVSPVQYQPHIAGRWTCWDRIGQRPGPQSQRAAAVRWNERYPPNTSCLSLIQWRRRAWYRRDWSSRYTWFQDWGRRPC